MRKFLAIPDEFSDVADELQRGWFVTNFVKMPLVGLLGGVAFRALLRGFGGDLASMQSDVLAMLRSCLTGYWPFMLALVGLMHLSAWRQRRASQ